MKGTSDSHWLFYSDVMKYAHPKIVVVLNDGTLSSIADVRNERAVRQMLRYTQLAQEVESLCDEYADLAIGDTQGQMNFSIRLMYLVRACIHETDGSNPGIVPCPEIDNEPL